MAYTKRAVAAVRDADWVVAVDNVSSDGTQEYLLADACRTRAIDGLICNEQNLFPGAACNIGWHEGLERFPDADLLLRLDNDIELLPGWKKWVERTFRAIPKLGQLGLLNGHEDYPDGPPWEKYTDNGADIYLANPGGPSVIRRELWDEGLRWTPGAWRPGGMDEDTRMSEHVRSRGFMVGKTVQTIANNMSFHRFDEYPDYYRQTAALRGLDAETSV